MFPSLLLLQGLEKIIWLWKGVAGDDSVVNGHVDNFAVSAGCRTAAMLSCSSFFSLAQPAHTPSPRLPLTIC